MTDLLSRTCPNCLSKFLTNRTDKIFCKPRCKTQYWMKNHPRVDLTKAEKSEKKEEQK